ncbi:hypothetical protein [Enterococcus sp. AZ192]|uniref:hypothetical protein n=1 Tax=unclassified Enterococcus TaxID=2608891 RepID=UPI003D2A90DC
MGNLGWYQGFTTVAKKVGGPKNLLSLVAVGGYVVIRIVGEGGVKKAYKLVKKRSKKPNAKVKQFLFLIDGENEGGLKFTKEDTFIVAAKHGNVMLIEKNGDMNNPYFVDLSWLKSVSNYETN